MSDYLNENPHTTLNRQLRLLPGFQLTLKPALVTISYLICFVLLDRITFAFEQSFGVAFWSLAVGLNLALLLIFGLRYIPVIFVATLITGFWQWRISFSPLTLLLFSLTPALSYGLAAFALSNKLKINPQLQHLRDMLWFVLVALATTLGIALLTITNFVISGLTPWPNDLSVISAVWLRQAISLVTLTPFLLIYLDRFVRARTGQKTGDHKVESKNASPIRLGIAEIVGQLGMVLLTLYIVFGGRPPTNFSLLYLCFLPLIWIILRRGLAGATVNSLITNITIFLIPIFGLGLRHVTELQIFMVMLSLTGLFLGVVVVPRKRILAALQAEVALQQSLQKLQVAYEHATTYAQELHQEITERELIEEALRQSEARIRSVVDNVVDGIITVDERNLIETFNAAAEKIFGYSAGEVIGKNFSLLMAEMEQQEMVASLSTWLDEQTENVGRSCEVIGLRQDKRTFPMDLAVSRFDLGERCMFIGIVRDITEQRHLEEQLRQAQKMEAIGQLAGGVAHDFNNILTVISGHTELLLRSNPELSVAQRRDVELIKQAGDRAASLTHQLLAFSRQQTFRLQLLNLNTIVANFKEMLPSLIGEDIVLKIDLDPQLGTVKADPGQMEQVLMNLVVNARDAMPRGGELMIKTAYVELDEMQLKPELTVSPGSYVMLMVTDTGVGMDPQTQRRVFDPFFTTKEQGKGTGLGLSTVYGIVRQSEGYIWLDSQVGQGATFTIYLPRVGEAIEVKEARPQLTPLAGLAENGTKTILLVEDEPSVRMITRRFLQRYNYVVLEASHPEQALELCQQHAGRIDLLITDLIMPYMNGHELAEQLTKMCSDLKVLYISGYTDDTLNEQGVLEPGVILLEKPFSSEALVSKVREALDAS